MLEYLRRLLDDDPDITVEDLLAAVQNPEEVATLLVFFLNVVYVWAKFAETREDLTGLEISMLELYRVISGGELKMLRELLEGLGCPVLS